MTVASIVWLGPTVLNDQDIDRFNLLYYLGSRGTSSTLLIPLINTNFAMLGRGTEYCKKRKNNYNNYMDIYCDVEGGPLDG